MLDFDDLLFRQKLKFDQRSEMHSVTVYVREEPVRFDSCRFRFSVFFLKSSVRFGSVRFGSVRQLILPIRCGSVCVFRTRRGSVRFGSVRFRLRFGVLLFPVL